MVHLALVKRYDVRLTALEPAKDFAIRCFDTAAPSGRQAGGAQLQRDEQR